MRILALIMLMPLSASAADSGDYREALKRAKADRSSQGFQEALKALGESRSAKKSRIQVSEPEEPAPAEAAPEAAPSPSVPQELFFPGHAKKK